MIPENKERRRYLRLNNNSVLKCEVFSAKNFNEQKMQDAMGGVVKNVSAGGVLFETNIKMDVGILLKIELNLIGWEKFKSEFYKVNASTHSSPLVVLAKVMRVEAIGDSGIYDIGLCIVAIDDGHKKALEKFVAFGSKH